MYISGFITRYWLGLQVIRAASLNASSSHVAPLWHKSRIKNNHERIKARVFRMALGKLTRMLVLHKSLDGFAAATIKLKDMSNKNSREGWRRWVSKENVGRQ